MDNMTGEDFITLRFHITRKDVVEGKHGLVQMLSFSGTSKTKWFEGNTLPGSVDTQYYLKGKSGMMSARYILEGQDEQGEKCRIFVDNSGLVKPDEAMVTSPTLFTDSKSLQWIEDVTWKGQLEIQGEELIIHIQSETCLPS